MDRAHIVRRIVHATAPLYLVYYLLPDDVGALLGPSESFLKWQGLVFILLGLALAETVRIITKKTLVGMRDYEMRRISATAWGGWGIGLAMLLFPVYVAVPAVITMGFVDPFCGELKRQKSRWHPGIPLVLAVGIYAVCLLLLSGFAAWQVALLSLIGGAIALFVEGRNFRYFDDDFLMIVVPGAVLAALTRIA